jgi:hypothetical protein
MYEMFQDKIEQARKERDGMASYLKEALAAVPARQG